MVQVNPGSPSSASEHEQSTDNLDQDQNADEDEPETETETETETGQEQDTETPKEGSENEHLVNDQETNQEDCTDDDHQEEENSQEGFDDDDDQEVEEEEPSVSSTGIIQTDDEANQENNTDVDSVEEEGAKESRERGRESSAEENEEQSDEEKEQEDCDDDDQETNQEDGDDHQEEENSQEGFDDDEETNQEDGNEDDHHQEEENSQEGFDDDQEANQEDGNDDDQETNQEDEDDDHQEEEDSQDGFDDDDQEVEEEEPPVSSTAITQTDDEANQENNTDVDSVEEEGAKESRKRGRESSAEENDEEKEQEDSNDDQQVEEREQLQEQHPPEADRTFFDAVLYSPTPPSPQSVDYARWLQHHSQLPFNPLRHVQSLIERRHLPENISEQGLGEGNAGEDDEGINPVNRGKGKAILEDETKENSEKDGEIHSTNGNYYNSDDPLDREILKTILAYRAETSFIPGIRRLHHFIKCESTFEISAEELNMKVSILEEKFDKIVKEKGLSPAFDELYNQEMFDLSKKIWGSKWRKYHQTQKMVRVCPDSPYSVLNNEQIVDNHNVDEPETETRQEQVIETPKEESENEHLVNDQETNQEDHHHHQEGDGDDHQEEEEEETPVTTPATLQDEVNQENSPRRKTKNILLLKLIRTFDADQYSYTPPQSVDFARRVQHLSQQPMRLLNFVQSATERHHSPESTSEEVPGGEAGS